MTGKERAALKFSRVGLEVVPGGKVVQGLGEEHFAGQVAGVALEERGADDVVGGLGEGDAVDGGGDVGLLHVVDVGLEVELLLGGLDGGVADAAAVDLLELEALTVVVVEGGVAEGVEAGAEVLIALRVGMEDVGEDSLLAGGRTRGGGRDDGGGEFAVALADVDGWCDCVARNQGTVGMARTRATPA